MFYQPHHNKHSLESVKPIHSPQFDQLIRQFCVSIPAPYSVSVILPPGCSRWDFLQIAHQKIQKIAQHPLIDEDMLSDWALIPTFREKYPFPFYIGVEIQRLGETPRKREELQNDLRSQARIMASQDDTAVAFAAYWLKNRSDLLGGTGVQTGGRGLQFNEDGLVEVDYFKTIAVAVSGVSGDSLHSSCQK